jgi:hypothetical protein
MEQLPRRPGRSLSIITTKAKFLNRKPRAREWRGFGAAIRYSKLLGFCRLSARVERQSHAERFLSRCAFRSF